MPESKKAEATVSIFITSGTVELTLESEGHTAAASFKARHPEADAIVSGKGTLWHDGWASLADRMLTLRPVCTGGRDWRFEFAEHGSAIARIEFVAGEGDHEGMEELIAVSVPVSWSD